MVSLWSGEVVALERKCYLAKLGIGSKWYKFRPWWVLFYMYCKSGNFREYLIFANGVKRHICHVSNSHWSINDLHQLTTDWFRHVARILFSRNFAYAATFLESKPSRNFRIYSINSTCGPGQFAKNWILVLEWSFSHVRLKRCCFCV